MEESLNNNILEYFGIEKKNINTYSALTLAYIGDAIFDLVIRSIIVGRGNTKPAKLHYKASRIVKASSQALMIEAIKEQLSEEEISIYKKGLNAKPATTAKNASYKEYRKATGFETLLGYLYLNGNMSRIYEITKLALETIDE